jgi:hypothetical protein
MSIPRKAFPPIYERDLNTVFFELPDFPGQACSIFIAAHNETEAMKTFHANWKDIDQLTCARITAGVFENGEVKLTFPL